MKNKLPISSGVFVLAMLAGTSNVNAIETKDASVEASVTHATAPPGGDPDEKFIELEENEKSATKNNNFSDLYDNALIAERGKKAGDKSGGGRGNR